MSMIRRTGSCSARGENFDYGSGITHTDADGKDPFLNYWAINLSEALIKAVGQEASMTRDHSDLWNKNEIGAYGVMRTWIITNWPSVGEGLGMSDLSKSTQILFWEVK